MTFEELIKKLRKDFPEAGVFEVFNNWYANIKKYTNYDNLYGMVWGLLATGYINESEFDDLTNEFIKMSW